MSRLFTEFVSAYIHSVSKNNTYVVHYNFDADERIVIILARNNYGVWAIIILFNFSSPFGIISSVFCEITFLYKPMTKSMRMGKFRPPQLRNRLIDFDEIHTL